MSSKYVRDKIKTFISSNLATENMIDLTSEFLTIEDLLDKNNLTYESDWLGLQFAGSEEVPINVGADNSSGCFRELGNVFIHIVTMATSNSYDNLINRAENIRNKFRGMRIDDIVIENVMPPNFEAGATLEFEGGFTSCSVLVGYYRDLNL